MLTQVLTPAIYRTTITHCRQVPVHHSFEYRSYSWYVDVDDLPRLRWWLRPFARFRAADHFSNTAGNPLHGSLRERLSAFFADNDLAAPEGRVTCGPPRASALSRKNAERSASAIGNGNASAGSSKSQCG